MVDELYVTFVTSSMPWFPVTGIKLLGRTRCVCLSLFPTLPLTLG